MIDRSTAGPCDPAQRLAGAALGTPERDTPPPRPYRPADLNAVPPPPLTLERLRRTQRRWQVVAALALLLAAVETARPWLDGGVLRGRRLELSAGEYGVNVTLDGDGGLVMERDMVELVRLTPQGGVLTLRHRDPEGVVTVATLVARWGLTLEWPEGTTRASLWQVPAGQLALHHPGGTRMLHIVARDPLFIDRMDRLPWRDADGDPLDP